MVSIIRAPAPTQNPRTSDNETNFQEWAGQCWPFHKKRIDRARAHNCLKVSNVFVKVSWTELRPWLCPFHFKVKTTPVYTKLEEYAEVSGSRARRLETHIFNIKDNSTILICIIRISNQDLIIFLYWRNANMFSAFRSKWGCRKAWVWENDRGGWLNWMSTYDGVLNDKREGATEAEWKVRWDIMDTKIWLAVGWTVEIGNL